MRHCIWGFVMGWFWGCYGIVVGLLQCYAHLAFVNLVSPVNCEALLLNSHLQELDLGRTADSVSLCPDVPTVFLRDSQQGFQTLSLSHSTATLWQATASVMMQWNLWLRLHRAFDWPLWIEYSLSCAYFAFTLSPFGLLLLT